MRSAACESVNWRPAEAGLDEGEAGLHEDDEDGAEHHPRQVDLLADLGLPRGRPRRKAIPEIMSPQAVAPIVAAVPMMIFLALPFTPSLPCVVVLAGDVPWLSLHLRAPVGASLVGRSARYGGPRDVSRQ
ncbi:MAG: hypothetical protein U0P45_08365 [Acidimicrobiales bacterium]